MQKYIYKYLDTQMLHVDLVVLQIQLNLTFNLNQNWNGEKNVDLINDFVMK